MARPRPIQRNISPSMIYPENLGREGTHHYVIFSMYNAGLANKKIGASIALYIPPGALKSTRELSYSEDEEGITRAVADVKERGGSDTEAVKAAAEKIASSAARKASQGVQNALGQSAGVVRNPEITTTFNNVGLRNFNFNYTFIAKSQREVDNIDRIVKTFEQASLPSRRALSGSALKSGVLELPLRFDIKFYDSIHSGGPDYYLTISECVCKSVDVSYDAGGKPSFIIGSGAPREIQLNMTFTERFAQARQDVTGGAFG